MARKIRQEKCSIAASLFAAILVFPGALVLSGFVIRGAVITITDSTGFGIAGLPDRFFDLIAPYTIFGLPILVAYLTSRTAYSKMRWKFIESDGRYCEKCGYDLTGNVSGRCPECGSPIATQAPADATSVEESSRAD